MKLSLDLCRNVFLYGRGVRERSEFYRLKAGYFTLKFHPQWYLILCPTQSFVALAMATRFSLQCRNDEGVTPRDDGFVLTRLHSVLLYCLNIYFTTTVICCQMVPPERFERPTPDFVDQCSKSN